MKLCDFGLSLPSSGAPAEGGTLPYMAPEALRGHTQRYNHRSTTIATATAPRMNSGARPTTGLTSSENTRSATNTKGGDDADKTAQMLFGVDVYAMGILMWEVLTGMVL